MKKLFYSVEGGESVHTKDFFLPNYDEILVEHVLDKSTERWCKEHMEIIDDGACGRHCKEYEPINGKKGKCKWSTWCCSETGRKFSVKNNRFKLVS